MIETVARKTGFTEAQVETTMDALFDQIADCLRADEKVTIAGFGRFEMRPRKPKAYTNPKTKVSSRLESTSIPGFKASGRFKQKLEAGRRSERGRDRLSAYIPDPTAEPCPKRARLFLRADKRRVSWYTEQNKGRRIRSIKHALQ
jgi:DNA-binding protein HU-beta